VVGIDSVGTRCWLALMLGRDDRNPLFLQVKEADASTLEPYLGRSATRNGFPRARACKRVVRNESVTTRTPFRHARAKLDWMAATASLGRAKRGDAREPRQRVADGNFRLGRFGGVDVRINWSWLVVFALIVWSLADGVFPSQNPGLSHGTHLAMAVVAALFFFASVLLHELGHAWAARREGIEIDVITLWLFGGVAQFKGRFPSAGAEFRVAVAGPFVTLFLGVLFVLVALLDLPSAVDGVAAWLGYINLFLLVFNLLPALPLDGGRVLHAALWRARGDLAWATRVAARIGQGFGYLFIALGIAMLIFQGSFSGAWLAFVGWFLLQAAGAEGRSAASVAPLEGLRVGDVMSRSPVTVDGDLTVGRVMDSALWPARFTTFPVVDGGRPVGLFTLRSAAAVPRWEWDTRRVRDAMIPLGRVPVFAVDTTAPDALTALSSPLASPGLVLDRGRVVGILSVADLAHALRSHRAAA
jgi:Zn-dependent protease/CBS domain-containing protein